MAERLTKFRLSSHELRLANELARMYRLQVFLEGGGAKPDSSDGWTFDRNYGPWITAKGNADSIGLRVILTMLVDPTRISERTTKTLAQIAIKLRLPASTIREEVRRTLESYSAMYPTG